MKRTTAIILTVLMIITLAACASKDSASNPGPNPSATATPVATATGGSNLFVLANFQLTGTQGIANCTLEDQSNSSWVNTATVTVNGNSVPFAADGVYMNLTLPGTYATGNAVTLVINSTFGTSTAIGSIPALGASANSVAVSNAKSGSVFNISH